MNLTKFNKSESGAIAGFYKENGYVIISELIPSKRIDELMTEYEKFKRKKNFLINAQDTNRPEKLRINQEGLIENSIMDPLDMTFAGQFPGKAKAIIINEEIAETLPVLSQKSPNVLWQSMFFDKSTGTVVHQDTYYLDSVPQGNVIGAWYSLENIHPDAGCFYVCPKSHLINERLFADKKHAEYVQAMLEYVKSNNIPKLACPLNKGDVLFWNSLTLHGSFENVNPKLSRKSFTAHFIPVGMERSVKKTPKIVPSDTKGILVRHKIPLKEKMRYVKTYIKYFFKNKFSSKVEKEMKNKAYR